MYEMLKFPKKSEHEKIKQLENEFMQKIDELPCTEKQKCQFRMVYGMIFLKSTDAAFRAGYNFGRITGDEYKEIIEGE